MEAVVAFNNNHDGGNKITISLDMEKMQTENLPLVNLADVVLLSKELAMHLGYENKTAAVQKFRQLTCKGLVCYWILLWYFFTRNLTYRNVIICPWGTDGVAALDSDDNFFTAEAYPPDVVVDSLGAGDTFAAAIIFALYQNYSLNFAIRFASQLAGMKVGFFGYDEIGKFFKNFL